LIGTTSDLKHNCIELISAVKSGKLVANFSGSRLYDASKGWGLLYRIIFFILEYALFTPCKDYFIKLTLRRTWAALDRVCYEAKIWAEYKKRFVSSPFEDKEMIKKAFLISSISKTFINTELAKKISDLFENKLGVPFKIDVDIDEQEFWRRVCSFEILTQLRFPIFEIHQFAQKQGLHIQYKKDLKEYEQKILTHPIPFASEKEKEDWKKRICKKLIKIMDKLPKRICTDQVAVQNVWLETDCMDLVTTRPQKTLTKVDSKTTISFSGVTFSPEKEVELDQNRDWTAIPINKDLEIISFNDVLKGPFYVSKQGVVLPTTRDLDFDFRKGLWLKERMKAWADLPLEIYREDLTYLLRHLATFRELPVCFRNLKMDLANLGYNSEGKVVSRAPSYLVKYHVIYLQYLLYEAAKKNITIYLELFNESKLVEAPLSQSVGDIFIFTLRGHRESIKERFLSLGINDSERKNYWKKPYEPLFDYLRKNPSKEEKEKVILKYKRRAFGSYPFEGLMEYLLTK
jgi:ribosomal protein S10